MTSPAARDRVHFDPDAMDTGAFYRVLNSVVVPRPIAWVCSRSADGVLNLAPHSFYTVACVDPPVVQFTSVGRKDSLRNVEETGEFTVSLAPEALFEQINATSGLGALITNARDFLQTDVIVVCLLVYAALGLATDALVRLLEAHALRWRPALLPG